MTGEQQPAIVTLASAAAGAALSDITTCHWTVYVETHQTEV